MDLKSTGSNPVFPIILCNSYAYTINHLNLTTTKKLFKVKIINTKKSLSLIKALNSVGCVNKYLIINSNDKSKTSSYIYLSIPFYKTIPFFKSVRLISTPSKHHHVSLKGLKLMSIPLNSSILILSTPKGIITHSQALKYRLGGRILCIIH